MRPVAVGSKFSVSLGDAQRRRNLLGEKLSMLCQACTRGKTEKL